MTGKNADALVGRLIEMKDDRGAMAALRSGLGKPPGSAARMYPIVARFLPWNASPSFVDSAFITASLFGSHPDHRDDVQSIGGSLWHATKREPGNPNGKHGEAGVEARFVAALDADPENLQRHLEGLVSLCRSANQGINWHALRSDVEELLRDQDWLTQKIHLRWAREFWRGPKEPENHE